ncbi:MAG: RNA polymerase sigma factor [Prevotellaceae bacterium]|jgi:RNA polymerase sigma factor, sigma-70 family|nr:RNA polymerase sigma factor [Bacteroidaceae bacterium]MCI6518740.1 RNA polymerase sigma factor [Prevotellaceae bacterium]MDD7376792.1 RNA polymerase sigma factor [Prevotellaceae bacterium]MDY4759092.1 RNA polymerase sigma factor [Bacteroidaceae bacterium]PWL82276.1 MAG: RNA polymerase subunit sigma-70 [Prevotellaceae bacterium]
MKKLSFRDDVLPLKDKIFRLALRITLSRAEAEDIVQDVLIKVWNRRDDLAEVDSIEAYSLTVCRNLSLDRLQRKENDNVNLDDAPPTEADDAPPDLQMIRNERIDNIKRLIERLPIPQRAAMQLRDMEGKTYKEISAITGQTEEQVKVNIFRARQYIRKQIEKIENYGL